MQCNQHGCENPAAFRFTWPGQNEKGICAVHVDKLRATASALGFYLQVVPIEPGE